MSQAGRAQSGGAGLGIRDARAPPQAAFLSLQLQSQLSSEEKRTTSRIQRAAGGAATAASKGHAQVSEGLTLSWLILMLE